LLATKFLGETLGNLMIENDRFFELMQKNQSTFFDHYQSMINYPEKLSESLQQKKPEFFFAEPILSEEICPEIQKNYTIAAVDGSQILSDDLDIRILPFLLINIGLIKTNYPRQEVVIFDSFPQLITKQKASFNGLGKDVAVYRTKGEFEIAIETIKNMQEDNILLIDGGLLQWHLTENGNGNHLKEETLALLSDTLQTAAKKKVHILGYISGTNAADVIGTLRIMQCDKDSFSCNQCDNSYCLIADRIKDENLYQGILPLNPQKKWNISPLFKSNVPMIEKYYKQDIFFFYLYNQFEFARIECTEFSISHLPFLMGVLQDQLEKGFGYPVILQEAHELAVLQKNDIITLEQYLVQQSKYNNKSLVCRSKNIAKKVKYI
jgi:hypothetical protein